MLVGRILYILGLIFASFSLLLLIMTLFNNGADMLIPAFGLLNGFIAMGVGDLVIDLNHKKRLESKSQSKV
ncbi:hypothetical protein [Litchfieldia alkalitelluris]|uniref:hypothetical protein n=1 Tax=Litchfieldia alkalitelluris TaxID=304268 RepID=UPI000995F0F6|nr:hypothetical protein [Litchfieldia alkalitelluris]